MPFPQGGIISSQNAFRWELDIFQVKPKEKSKFRSVHQEHRSEERCWLSFSCLLFCCQHGQQFSTLCSPCSVQAWSVFNQCGCWLLLYLRSSSQDSTLSFGKRQLFQPEDADTAQAQSSATSPALLPSTSLYFSAAPSNSNTALTPLPHIKIILL